ncbi:hypothetical protein BDY24DRAFT_415818 [Mrakia frigida]|uniref:uncharacterized protein n=1 Tax=Mrakia frigida TaxID=29902 RepID=UPI003FCC22F3
MDSLNSTIVNATTAIPPTSHSLLAALGLGSLAGALGGAGSAGGLASVGLLLSSIVPLLMSTSSWIRGWAFGPFRWLLDVLFVSAYVKSSSPVYSWIVAYISSRPYKIHTSKKIEIQVVKDSEVEEHRPNFNGRYDDDEIDQGYDQDASAARLHDYKLAPFPSSHTLLLLDGNLLLISRSKIANHSLVREDGKARRRVSSRNEDDNGEAGEEVEYLKIRILPLPPLLSAFNRLFSIFSTPLPSSLESSVSSPPRTALDNLVAASKEFYAKKDSKGISVYRWEQYNECWRGKVTRGKKSVESVILPGGIGIELLRDVKDFLGRKKWYQERGIPHRRGVLLYGEPGGGKTSIVSAISSELSLNIYLLTLSDEKMSDSDLLTAIAETPPNCLILIEDIDCAFVAPRLSSLLLQADPDFNTGSNSITLSGLLNALDGVCSVDGRVIFATTNHIDRLDPALKRPGRFDVQIQFNLACTEQIEGLFTAMMSPSKGEIERARTKRAEKAAEAGASVLAVEEDLWAVEKRSLVEELSKEFGTAVPEGTFSTASLQGYLLKWKDDPQGAVEAAAGWVNEQQLLIQEQRQREAEEWALKKKIRARDDRRYKKEAKRLEEDLEKDSSSESDAEDEAEDEKKSKKEDSSGSDPASVVDKPSAPASDAPSEKAPSTASKKKKSWLRSVSRSKKSD